MATASTNATPSTLSDADGVDVRTLFAHDPEAKLDVLLAREPKPAAVIIDSELSQAGSLARRAQTAVPLAQIVFVTAPERVDDCQAMVRAAQLRGAHWAIVPRTVEFNRLLEEQISIGHRRQRHRTTLDRLNFRLREAPTVDARRVHRLIASERFLATLVNTIPDAVVALTPAGEIASWNASAERLWKTPSATAIGRAFSLFIDDAARDALQRVLQLVAGTKDHLRRESIARRSDGSRIPVEITVAPVLDELGEIAAFSLVARDITDRKQAEKTRQEQQQQLESLVEERTAQLRETIAQLEQFSYTVSHDLRGPLRSMHGFAEALLEDFSAQLDPTAVDYVRRIARAANRLDRLIQDVLAYSRVATIALERAEIDLDRLTDELIAQYAPQRPAEIFHIRHPLHPVIGHEALLAQALGNLIGNALKFVAAGERPRVEIWTERRDSRVRVFVRDFGIGIPPAAAGRVFEMFDRGVVGNEYEGTGIGLPIVKKSVERLGGTVGFAAAPQKGTIFWIELPSAQ